MNWRLIVAIFSTLLDEAVVVVLLLWGLPKLGIRLPVPALVVIGIAWACFAVVLYVSGSKILRKQPLGGLTTMTGFRGKAVQDLAPEGLVKIKGELWTARSVNGNIDAGEEVIVEEQKSLMLMVRPRSERPDTQKL